MIKMTQTRTAPLPIARYTDKYFARSREILEKEGLNPWVTMQVFVRKGPGIVGGIDEAVDLILNNSDIEKVGGRIYALRDGSQYRPKETFMLIETPLQSIVELETVYLGIIAAGTTIASGDKAPNLDEIVQNTRRVVETAEGRPVMYFGARHWHYSNDAAISRAAFEGGATSCSTDAGAETFGSEGVGTIPHALVIAFASKYGIEKATAEATKAFDRHMPENIPRIALVDTFRREIDDSIATAQALEGRLYGVRVDTCGENVMQCGVAGDRKYWEGTGPTIYGVLKLREYLDKTGFDNVKITLSSGFGNAEKVRAFVEAEKQLGVRLFDSLGVGGFYESRMSTADIVRINGIPFAKTGRMYTENLRLERRL